MFGYITVNRSELKVKELARYESWYCGLCHALKDESGISGQMTLTYDMTFLAILLSSLYDKPVERERFFCPVHPASRHVLRRSVYSDYAAGMNVLLSYYDMADDWKDDRNTVKYLQSRAVLKSAKDISRRYPRQGAAVRDYVRRLSECESDAGSGIERGAYLTGRMLGEIFAVKDDEWSGALRTMGFFLGKFIYLTDAYEDIEKDIKSSSYNPLKQIYGREDFDDICKEMLAMQMSECCRAFEILPVVRDAGILRNILYSGVWVSFARVYRHRNNITDKAGDIND